METKFNRAKYTTGEYDGYCSSPEILFAIEQVTGEELPGKKAQQQWESPGPYELQRIEEIAWSVAEEDEDVLLWGMSEVYR